MSFKQARIKVKKRFLRVNSIGSGELWLFRQRLWRYLRSLLAERHDQGSQCGYRRQRNQSSF